MMLEEFKKLDFDSSVSGLIAVFCFLIGVVSYHHVFT